MQIQVEGGLAACYHELARRLAMLRRNMEILKAFQGVDLEKQSGCQLQTDIVLGMPLQYHTVLTALVPLHVGAVFHRQATKLTDELEEKNKLLNKGATMSSVPELEELVQAVTDKAARCDADAMAELRRNHGVTARTVHELLSGDGGAVVPRATFANAVIGRGGGMGGMRMSTGRGVPMAGRGGKKFVSFCRHGCKARPALAGRVPGALLYRRSPRRRPRASASQFRRDSASWAARTKKNGQTV